MTYPTIMPALTLDFQNSQQLDPRVTFSRTQVTGQATYINSAGQVAYAAEHEARFDHDPVTGECLGLLIEESRTNIAEQSEDLNTWWIKLAGVTVTSNAIQAPDGLAQADKLVSPNSVNRFSLYKQLALTANKTYTLSCFAKAGEWNFFTLAVGKSGSPYTRASYTIDLTTGDVNQGPWQNTPASESFTKTQLSNGWWRLAVSVKVDSTSTDFQFEMGMSPTNQFNNGMTGDGTSGVYMWGAQIEDSTFPSSFIPTSGSTVNRSEDIAQVTTADIYGDEFTIINKPFGVSSGGSTLHLQGYPHVERAAVYNGYLNQEQINTVAGVDEFWRWRVLGNSWEIKPTMSGTVTVDWGDGSSQSITHSDLVNHTFTDGSGYHDVGFRLDSGSWFSVNLNYTAAAEREKAVAVGPMPVGMATTGYLSYNYLSNVTAWDANLVHAYGGPNSYQLGRTYSGLTSLKSFPFIVLDSQITSLSQAFNTCSSINSFPLIDTSSITNFQNTWKICSSLTTFPAIDTSSGTNFNSAWAYCSSLTSFPLIDTSSGTSFAATWKYCSSLTSFPPINTGLGTNFDSTWENCSSISGAFPLIDTSNATTLRRVWKQCSGISGTFPQIETGLVTNFQETWRGCSSISGAFPLIDTSSGTNFYLTWNDCSSITSFLSIDTSSGTNFGSCWSNCSSLTSFPLIDTSSGASFSTAWKNCSALTDFPANFFNSWSATPANQCFYQTWDGCSSLTPASVVNILDSIAVSGVSAPSGTGSNHKKITIDWDGTGTPATTSAAAITTLKSRNWEIYLNNVAQ